MHVRCPHCQNAIDVVDDASLQEIDCPSCGSSFSLLGEGDTITIEHGAPQTSFMKFGDRVRIRMDDENNQSIFGTIDQVVEKYEGP